MPHTKQNAVTAITRLPRLNCGGDQGLSAGSTGTHPGPTDFCSSLSLDPLAGDGDCLPGSMGLVNGLPLPDAALGRDIPPQSRGQPCPVTIQLSRARAGGASRRRKKTTDTTGKFPAILNRS